MHSRHKVHSSYLTSHAFLLRRNNIIKFNLQRRLSLNQDVSPLPSHLTGQTTPLRYPLLPTYAAMPRKSSPQALAIVGSSTTTTTTTAGIDEHQQEQQKSPGTELNKHIIRSNNERINNTSLNSSPLSPLSPTTPKSPRSPFKFSLKPASHNNNSITSGGRPPMQAPDAQQQQLERDDQNRIDLPTSPTSPFHPGSQNQTPSADVSSEKRQGKGGFFSNYKASKSSSKVNASKSQVPDESISGRETNQPEMTSKVAVSSAAEAKKNGMTRPCFSIL